MPGKDPITVGSLLESLSETFVFLALGAFIGMGQLLASREDVTLRIALGRAISVGGLSAAAGVIWLLYPNIPFGVQVSVAAALASLGTSGLEKIFQRILGINK